LSRLDARDPRINDSGLSSPRLNALEQGEEDDLIKDFRLSLAVRLPRAYIISDELVPTSAVGAFVPKDLVPGVAAKHRDELHFLCTPIKPLPLRIGQSVLDPVGNEALSV